MNNGEKKSLLIIKNTYQRHGVLLIQKQLERPARALQAVHPQFCQAYKKQAERPALLRPFRLHFLYFKIFLISKSFYTSRFSTLQVLFCIFQIPVHLPRQNAPDGFLSKTVSARCNRGSLRRIQSKSCSSLLPGPESESQTKELWCTDVPDVRKAPLFQQAPPKHLYGLRRFCRR